jgi:restriction system protein
MPASSFAASLSEDAGERSGFALDRQQMLDHLPENHGFRDAFAGEDRLLRIGSDDYADAVGDLLYALGAADQPGMPSITERLVDRLGPDWRSKIELTDLMTVEAIANHYLRQRLSTGQFDLPGLEAELTEQIGRSRRLIMDDLLDVMPVYLAQSPYFTRSEKNIDAIALSNLFASEKLPVDGTFFDQRFVNYLSVRPDLLRSVHWRQFEGLAAEWLSRQGYDVELGPGRDDGGVDIRAWRKNAASGTPPVIVAQCKRQKSKIDKVVVKALWTDVHAEQAEAGLIVTTSDISPGAAQVIEARACPVNVANGEQVRRWVTEMRRPAAGIVL